MTEPHAQERNVDPGVPEALPRALIRLRERIGVEDVDCLWLFPPVRRGRREQGLVAVSTFLVEEDRRAMVTLAYTAEETGKGVTVDCAFTQEGEAPPERFPTVMAGVVRRAGEAQPGDPRVVEIGGSAESFETLLEEFDMDFLEAPQP